MGEVMVTFKVMPKGVDVNLDSLESEIKGTIKADRITREPVAFGLVALNVITIMPDDGSVMDETEKKLRSLEGVGEVEVTEITKTL